MTRFFTVVLSDQTKEFLDQIDVGARNKILYNIDKSSYFLDSKVLKKITDDIWEFRTRYKTMQYRLLAFWDRRDKNYTLVITTHGIVKKSQRLPKSDIERARRVRKDYFEQKRK